MYVALPKRFQSFFPSVTVSAERIRVYRFCWAIDDSSCQTGIVWLAVCQNATVVSVGVFYGLQCGRGTEEKESKSKQERSFVPSTVESVTGAMQQPLIPGAPLLSQPSPPISEPTGRELRLRQAHGRQGHRGRAFQVPSVRTAVCGPHQLRQLVLPREAHPVPEVRGVVVRPASILVVAVVAGGMDTGNSDILLPRFLRSSVQWNFTAKFLTRASDHC